MTVVKNKTIKIIMILSLTLGLCSYPTQANAGLFKKFLVLSTFAGLAITTYLLIKIYQTKKGKREINRAAKQIKREAGQAYECLEKKVEEIKDNFVPKNGFRLNAKIGKTKLDIRI